ncbi:hypothetical protein AKJ13_15760 [Methylobacterium sp. ARG-1]|nr:hypothetical protein AKJ13_15760 [Methylobacterium sp. ARG-1]
MPFASFDGGHDIDAVPFREASEEPARRRIVVDDEDDALPGGVVRVCQASASIRTAGRPSDVGDPMPTVFATRTAA